MFRVHHMVWAAIGQNTQDRAGTPRSEEIGRLEVAVTGPWGVAPAAPRRTLSQRHRCRALNGHRQGLGREGIESWQPAALRYQLCKMIKVWRSTVHYCAFS